MYQIVLTSPFRRTLAYEFDTRSDAEEMAKVIKILAWDGQLTDHGILPETSVETIVVPAGELTNYYDA